MLFVNHFSKFKITKLYVYHFSKRCEDPEELSGRFAVVCHVFVDQRDQRGQDAVDVVTLRFAVELLVVVERSLDLQSEVDQFKLN